MRAYHPLHRPAAGGTGGRRRAGGPGAEPPATSVAEIQARHDRAFVRELSEYLAVHPRADDRDQAYAALFNKAIEHDWFAEVEDLGRQYLKSDPDGPVKALAQIILTMARAQAGRYDEALARFRELIAGLDPNEQEEFASSFSDSFAGAAIAAGEYSVARQAYAALLDRFGESPNLRQKVQADLKRLDQVGKTRAGLRRARTSRARTIRNGDYRGKYVLLDFWATWCGPCVAELPRLQAAYRAYHDAGFEIVGISLDESKDAVVDFVKARKVPWPQVHNARRCERPGRRRSAWGRSPRPTSSIPRGRSSGWTSAARPSTRPWPG